MSSSRVVILLALWLAYAAAGCSLPLLQTSALMSTSSSAWKHGLETRAIANFLNALEDEDLPRLRNTVTPRFHETSLNYDEAISDLKLLNLPSGEVSILEVTPLTEESWEVKAQVGEAGREYTYLLAMDRRTHAMLIDDIVIAQRESEHGEVTQTVTAQLELLKAGRRFLTAWSPGSREQVLAQTTEYFRTELSGLPASFLVELTDQVAGDRRMLTNYRPEARIDSDRAAMVFRRSGGTLLLEMKRVDGTWLVNDAALESNRNNETITSARRLARTLRTAAEFLTAYGEGDQETLARTSQTGFYEACLKASNPDAVPIPVGHLLSGSFELRRHGETVDILLSHDGQTTYLVSLAPTPPTSLEDDSDRSSLPKLVQEVTIYEGDGSEVKTLTAIYTSRIIAQIFAHALMTRDAQRLSYLSSPDFNAQVWEQCDADVLQALPFDGISREIPEVISTVFHGPVTEVTVRQGEVALTYVLKQGSDRLRVDDVLVPSTTRPASLKTNLMLLVPVYRMAYAVYGNNRDALASTCGYTLSRTCTQLDRIPDIGCSMVDHLLLPVASIHPSADRTIIKLGDDRFGTNVTLRNESNRWVVEDVSFITGRSPEQRVELLAALRRYNTNLQLNLSAPGTETRTAEATPADTAPVTESPVEQAGYTPDVAPSDTAFGAE